MSIFKGAGVAIVTPFHEDGSVNYEAFGEQIERQIAGKTDAIIVCGTTGEASTLSHEEHLDVIRYCVEKVIKEFPLLQEPVPIVRKQPFICHRKRKRQGLTDCCW